MNMNFFLYFVLLFGCLIFLMSNSKMDKNETIEYLKDKDDKNEDNTKNGFDKGFKKWSCVWNHFIEKKKINGSMAT